MLYSTQAIQFFVDLAARSDHMMDELWVIIPAYNEAQVLGQVLSGFSGCPYRLVVVDDGSTDDTAQVALRYPVSMLRHIENLGQGAALQTGICYALTQPRARLIATFDADGQHHVEDIDRLAKALAEARADVALGSRFLQGGGAEHIRPQRRVILRLATLFTRLLTGLRVTDTHNGVRVFTRDAAARIHITQNRMSHASELLDQIAALKLKYIEVPVTVTYTHYSLNKGQSLFNGINILWDIITGKMR